MKAFVGCAGFGLVDIALTEYGLEVVGVEIDPAIAFVNWLNGGNVITADMLDIEPADYAGYTLVHFSPPCPRFSVARSSKKARLSLVDRISDLARYQVIVNGESEADIALARKICQFIRVVRPEYFTLENVWQYRNSLSWLNIWHTLRAAGYGVGAWNLNAADYGTPQTRRRMVVIARRDGREPTEPFPTHGKKPDMLTLPWVGWYEALYDLLPGLPDSEFSPWQLARLPAELRETILVMTGNTNFLEANCRPGRGVIEVGKPANTVMATNNSLPRAFLVPGDNTQNGVVRSGDEPMVTVQTRPPERCPHRAFILGQGQRSSPKPLNAPADTVTANSNQTGVKAFVVGGQYQTPNKNGRARVVQNRAADEPIWTVTANEHGDTRAWQNGRVVSLSPRCLARLQDFPDWFALPKNRELACKGVGNAMPPGLKRAVLVSLGFRQNLNGR